MSQRNSKDNETIMLHVNTKDNENGRRRRDKPKGLSLQRGVRGGFERGFSSEI